MKDLFRSLTLIAALLAIPLLAQAQPLRVAVAPPALRVEVRPRAPSPRHVWSNGYWAWRGSRHVWEPGRWLAGRPGSIWVNPHWANEGGQWIFYEGHWVASTAPGGEVVVETAPPPPRVEVVPPQREWPEGHIWLEGHWEWHGGHHEWIPGRYEPRREGHHFEQHRWEHEDGKWRHRGGEWRHD